MRQEESPYGLQELPWSLRGDPRRDPVSQPLLSVSPSTGSTAGPGPRLGPDWLRAKEPQDPRDSRFPDQVLPPAHRENSVESKPILPS